MPAQDTNGPLSGVRIIDLTIYQAGPIAAMLLADLGADVIKVESIAGDPTRRTRAGAPPDLRPGEPPTTLSWATCNRNKRSVVLDLSDDGAQPVFHQLLASADVMLTNLHPRTLRQLKADEETVHAVNPKLVYTRVAGLGDRGPRAEDYAQDMTGMSYSGILFQYSNREDVPFAPPGAMNDVMTATMAAFGTLAAIMQQRRTGEGQYISGSLVQTPLWAQMMTVGTLANTTTVSEVHDRDHPRSGLVNQYKCGDGRWICMAGIEAKYWPIFCDAVGAQHLMADERFATFEGMQKNSLALVPLLDAHFAGNTSDYFLERMRAQGLWCGRVNQLEEVLTDEHIEANGYLETLSDGSRTVAMPFHLRGYQPGLQAGPPLGANTDEVLAELGINVGTRA